MIGALSLGQRQKLGIARALLFNPNLLVLDEPHHVWTGALISFGSCSVTSMEGMTIVLSSHRLSELENLCSKVAMAKRVVWCTLVGSV